MIRPGYFNRFSGWRRKPVWQSKQAPPVGEKPSANNIRIFDLKIGSRSRTSRSQLPRTRIPMFRWQTTTSKLASVLDAAGVTETLHFSGTPRWKIQRYEHPELRALLAAIFTLSRFEQNHSLDNSRLHRIDFQLQDLSGGGQERV